MNRKNVVTYQTPNGVKVSVCKAHEQMLEGPDGLRDKKGAHFCSVYYGQHYGVCDICHTKEDHCA